MKGCLIYINTENNNYLLQDIHEIIGKDGEIFLEKNSDFDIKRSKNFPNGFLYFRNILEISINEDSDEITLINKILNFLWNKNIPAIASCDFEVKLINKGGYNNKSLPF